jgi:MscS family membrane protein
MEMEEALSDVPFVLQFGHKFNPSLTMTTNYFWWIEALIGVAALVGLQYAIKRIIFKTGKQEEGWKRRIGNVFQRPLTVLIWVLIVFYLIDVCEKHFEMGMAIDYIGALRKAAVAGCFGWLFLRWKSAIEQNLLTDGPSKVDRTTVQIVGRLATLGIGILTILFIMHAFGVNIMPLLAFGSIGAAAIGFASKDVMANFCSGIMLQITRPFVSGDQIVLPEKHLEGLIEEIGWFRTTIRDTEKRAVYLPNNFFSTQLVVNVSRMTHRKFKQIVRVPLGSLDKLLGAIDKIRDTLVHLEGIDAHYPVHVNLKSFGEYACEIELEAYSTVTDLAAFNRFQQDILLKIHAILEEKKIPLAIPMALWKQIS